MGAQLQDMFARLQGVRKVTCALPKLYTEGFEGEQIFEQLSILDDAVQKQCSAAVNQASCPPPPTPLPLPIRAIYAD